MIDKIYIPTLGRADRQITYDNLPDFLKKRTVLVIEPREKKLYKDKPILVLDKDKQGIGYARKFIWEHAQGTVHIVADDDLQFKDRNPGYGINITKEEAAYSWKTSKKETMTKDNWKFFEKTTCKWFEEGIGFSGMRLCNYPPTMWHNGYANNTSIFCLYVFSKNLPKVNELDWSLKLAEDAHLVLQLLRKGHSNRVWDKFCVQSNQFTKGGCSEYRTIDDTNRSHNQLMEKHPKYVKFGTPNTKVGEIQKIKVNWNKAYKDNSPIIHGSGKLI